MNRVPLPNDFLCIGEVISSGMNKTIVVRTVTRVPHAKPRLFPAVNMDRAISVLDREDAVAREGKNISVRRWSGSLGNATGTEAVSMQRVIETKPRNAITRSAARSSGLLPSNTWRTRARALGSTGRWPVGFGGSPKRAFCDRR